VRISLHIKRQSRDQIVGVSDYDLDCPPQFTVLDCLDLIASKFDQTLAFRENCFSGVCGECGMQANGKNVLACRVRVDSFEESEIVLAPLKNHPVVRDLVVDREAYFSRILAAGATFYSDNKVMQVSHADMQRAQQTTRCIHCGLCISACEAYPEHPGFVGPAAMAWTARFLEDPRDGARERRRQLAASPQGTSACVDCGLCDIVCPEHVAPFAAIQRLR
jgi:succinate dehydrogenase/fumarate reductase iron-sulfur protein